MEHTPLLEMPTFLFGTFNAVRGQAREEGQKYARQYQQDGSLFSPGELQALPPGAVVILHDVVDFARSRPAWRLYVLGDAVDSLCQAFNYENSSALRSRHEELALETAWGALYYATGRAGPYDAGCSSRRLEAVIRFWEAIDSARFLFSSPSAPLTLEELMMDACGWAPRAWCPEGGASFRSRLEVAAARMGRATKEECIEAILRQLPHTLPLARKLENSRVLADPGYWRERMAMLAPDEFSRMSAALPAELLLRLSIWDKQLALE
jgi:hypothetical protein